MAWIDKKLYWAWVEDRKPGSDGRLPPQPEPPSKKELDYVTSNKGKQTEHKLCIGVFSYVEGKAPTYEPMNRAELETYLIRH